MTFSKTNLFVFAMFTAALIPPGLRAERPECSVATMHGTYAVTGSGFSVGANGAITPVTTLGTVTYDGLGGGSGSSTLSAGGTIIQHNTATATFTVNPDCTGSKTFTSTATGAATHFDFVITPDGATIKWIVTNSGAVLSGQATRLYRDIE